METLKSRWSFAVGRSLACVAAVAVVVTGSAAAQGGTAAAGPSDGLAVRVTGGTVAATQSGPWTVQVIPELYSSTAEPACDAGNRCYLEFAAVPAGRVLRVTRVYGTFFTGADGWVSLRIDSRSSSVATAVLFSFPVTHFSGTFEGNVLSFNQETDVIFTAGQHPVLVVGSPAVGDIISGDSRSRLGLTGTLVPVP